MGPWGTQALRTPGSRPGVWEGGKQTPPGQALGSEDRPWGPIRAHSFCGGEANCGLGPSS